jgi:hypothetical protein
MDTYRDGILGHQFDKRIESFATRSSQSLLLPGFKENQENHSGFNNYIHTVNTCTKKPAKQENSSLFMN